MAPRWTATVRYCLILLLAGLILALSLGPSPGPIAATDPTLTTFTPTPRDPELSGPMRGLYQWRGMQTVPNAHEQDAYERYTWRDLTRRTAQGQWVLDLSPIDDDADSARQQRQKFAFRVQAVADGGKEVPDSIPGQWCGGTFVPFWNSPTFLRESRRLVEALGQHFDGDPRIAWVEIGLYGRWAEWHTYGLCGPNATETTWKALVDMHIQAFPTTRLIMLSDHEQALRYALQQSPRIGWRRDSWAHPQFAAITRDAATWALARDRWQTAPVIVESYGGGQHTLSLGRDQIAPYHIALVGNGNFHQDWRQLNGSQQTALRAAGRSAGATFRLTALTLPAVLPRGTVVPVVSHWANLGVTPAYEPWTVQFELRQGATTVWQTASSLNLEILLPTADHAVSDQWHLPATLQPGRYDLVLVVTDPSGYRRPLPLAIEGQQADGSYRLGQVQVADPPQPGTDPIRLPIQADTFVRDGATARTTFGAQPWLQVKHGNPGWSRRTYLRVAVPPLATSVESATLWLYVPSHGLPQGAVRLQVYALYSDVWDEAQLVWADQPWDTPALRGPLQDDLRIEEPGWVAVDVRTMLERERQLGHTAASFVLLADGPEQRLLTLASHESPTPPYLTIDVDR